METFIQVARYLNILFLTALATVLFVQWRTRKDRSSFWAWLTFAALALGFMARRLIPDDPEGTLLQLVDKATIALLLLFPYLLYRIVSAFESRRSWLDVPATLVTAVLVLWTLALPASIEAVLDADPRPTWFIAYILMVVVDWLFLSFTVAWRFWKSSRGFPPVARKRMRMLSTASIILSVAIVLAAFVSGDRPPGVEIAFRLLLLASGPLFFVAFAPPAWLRTVWRRRAEEEFRAAVVDLVAADTRAEIANRVAVHAEHLVGAEGIVLVDSGGNALAARHGHADPVTTPFKLEFPFGSLTIQANPYTPFFGTQEIDLLRSLGTLADLAFQRVDTAEMRRELEQARLERDKAAAHEANLAKTEFLSRMSHELRTPLNAVLGFAELLDLESATAEQKEASGEIVKAGKHLLDLINEVLDIATIEAGRLRLSLEPVNAIAVTEECVSLLQPLADDETIILSLDRTNVENSEPHVVADAQRLKQVLLNLIANGIKYNRKHGRVRVSFSFEEDDRLRIDVADTGNGIEQAKLPQLFVPFDRLGAEASGVEGTGLGLALSKSLVEAMEGTLSVQSEVGKGTTFSVELYRSEASPDAAAPRQASEREPAQVVPVQAVGSKRVLYIEDNLSNIRLIERLINRRAHLELIPAMQAGIGLLLAREQHPDLILLDVNLPDIPGIEVLLRLQSDPETADIPVVMLSADASPSRIQRLREAGACDYVTKPIDVARFYDLLDEYCAAA